MIRDVRDELGLPGPTLLFPDGQCPFGSVLIDPLTGPATARPWESTTVRLEFPHLYELQRSWSAKDGWDITTALGPYMAGGHSISIDRERVVPFPLALPGRPA